MPRLTSLLLFMAIAGCASTNTTRSSSTLRIDATNVPAFEASIAAFQHDLRPNHRLRFEVALQEIWSATEFQAGPESSQHEKTKRYLAQLDGLGYDQVISLAGPAAEQTYQALVAEQLRERVGRAPNPTFSGFGDSTPVGGNNSGVYTGQTPAWSAY